MVDVRKTIDIIFVIEFLSLVIIVAPVCIVSFFIEKVFWLGFIYLVCGLVILTIIVFYRVIIIKLVNEVERQKILLDFFLDK